jgi:hypothetical protein
MSADAVAQMGRSIPSGSSLPLGKLSPDHHRFLEKTLRGQRAEQPCWAREDFRNHALKAAVANFSDDWNWCVQVTHAIYSLNPKSIHQIDSIVGQHLESRAGA